MRPVFLCGTGRSGTTILRRTLSLHPEVAAMPGELRLFIDPSGILDIYETLLERWDPYRADNCLWRFRRFLMEITSKHDKIYENHKTDEWTGGAEWYENRVSKLMEELSLERIPARWTGGIPGRNWMWETIRHDSSEILQKFVEDLYRHRNPDAKIFVEDTPYTICHYRSMKKFYSNKRPLFIFCVRNPRDIYSSFLYGGKHWTPNDPDIAAKRIESIFDICYSIPCITWRLEDFVSDPILYISDLCSYLKIDRENPKALTTFIDKDKAHIDRWKDELTERDLSIYKRYLSPWENYFGYENEH